MKRIILAMGLVATCLFTVGCGDGPKIAKVSGVVKVDGKPYPNAVVSFQPHGTIESPNPGRGSSAVTDENGRYVLLYDGTSTQGAVVGSHRVRINTAFGGNTIPTDSKNVVPSEDGEPLPGEKLFGNQIDPIPPEWNDESQKDFTVPPEGTDQADFEIVGRKTKKK